MYHNHPKELLISGRWVFRKQTLICAL